MGKKERLQKELDLLLLDNNYRELLDDLEEAE